MLPGGLRLLGALLADLAFPRKCGACLRPLPPGEILDICRECSDKLPFMAPPYCVICGAGQRGDPSVPRKCGRCRRRKPSFRLARGAFRYEGVIRKAIHEFKFMGRSGLAPSLADLMQRGLRNTGIFEGADCIVPVPLHSQRLKERGYDQTMLLGRRLSEIESIPLNRETLLRLRPTRAQVGMDLKSRALNVRGAFAVRPGKEPRGMKVLLLDDVMTTGATAEAASRTLMDAGAVEVRVAALARD